MARQEILFDPADIPPAVKYEKLFEHLPKLNEQLPKTGRHPVNRNCLLKALIYKALRRLPFLSDLTFELNNNPSVSKALGFHPLLPAPSVERFSSFVRDTDNKELKTVEHQLVQTLIELQVISGKVIAPDSCPIVAPLKENNLKTSIADRFDKTKRPAGDRDARLGVMIHYPNPFKKKVQYFWGYRNHIISDAHTELPICETTQQAQVHEVEIAKKLILEAKDNFKLNIEAVIADANFDAEHFLRFIIKDLKAMPIIPRNPRNEQPKGYQIKGNTILCEAGLPMYRKGRMRPKRTGILYCQYTCPIHYDKHVRPQYIICPLYHPKFLEGKGCNVLIRLEPSIREQIDYGTKQFKELYTKRTSVERVFSRLLAVAMQQPTVRGYNANKNHATIAHLAVLLVALSAQKSGHPDKIRFVKSFVPCFLN